MPKKHRWGRFWDEAYQTLRETDPARLAQTRADCLRVWDAVVREEPDAVALEDVMLVIMEGMAPIVNEEIVLHQARDFLLQVLATAQQLRDRGLLRDR